eukprot:scaffold4479_cov39-Prasinocladus_malaysianus.AAC.1
MDAKTSDSVISPMPNESVMHFPDGELLTCSFTTARCCWACFCARCRRTPRCITIADLCWRSCLDRCRAVRPCQAACHSARYRSDEDSGWL